MTALLVLAGLALLAAAVLTFGGPLIVTATLAGAGLIVLGLGSIVYYLDSLRTAAEHCAKRLDAIGEQLQADPKPGRTHHT